MFRLLLLATATLLTAFGAPSQQNTGMPESNVAMGTRLRAIYRGTDWRGDPSKAAERAAYYERLLRERTLSDADTYTVRLQLAQEHLRAGDVETALGALAAAEPLLSAVHATPQMRSDFLHLRGLTFLRLGETENCIANHRQHSCVFPIRAAGVHTLPRGAEGAVRDFTTLLVADPHDDLARWLLNVAYMQLGRYPRDVPANFVMPEKLFASEAAMPEWTDMATLAGLDLNTRSGGAAVEDFDGDGLLDIVTSTSDPLGAMHLFHNNGDGTFSDRTKEAGLADEIGGLNVVSTDYDNDGRPDLLVLRGGWWGKFGEYPFSLLHNRGGGTFEDVTVRARLLTFGPTQTAAWADFDGDGRLDFFVGHENAPERGEHYPSNLFHNNGDGTFTDVAKQLGLAEQGYVKGVAWGDFNNDGRPDLYVSCRDGENKLYRNDGPASVVVPQHGVEHWRFTDVTAQAGLAHQHRTFATWFFDYDNDGWPDLFVAGYSAASMQDVGHFELRHAADAEMPHLYRNNHDGTFTDVAHAMHLDRAMLTMGSNFGDFDNDGWLDLYLGTGEPSYEALLPNRAFRNNAAKAFQDVTTATGLGHLQKGHAVVFADLENRGVQDIIEQMGGAFPGDAYPSSLYRNPLREGGTRAHSVTLLLEGTRSNRAAYGARVEVVFAEPGANGRPTRRHVFRTVGSVSSFGSGPMQLHIGLGGANTVQQIRVRWPATPGDEAVYTDLRADAAYRIVERDAKATAIPRGRFHLGDTLAPMPMEHH